MKTAIFSQVDAFIKTKNKEFKLYAYFPLMLDSDFSFVMFYANDYQDAIYYADGNFSKNVKIYTICDIKIVVFELKKTLTQFHQKFYRQNFECGYKNFEVVNYTDGAYKLNIYDGNISQNITLPFRPRKTDFFIRDNLIFINISGKGQILLVLNPVSLEILFKKVCDEIIFCEDILLKINHFTHLHHQENITLSTKGGLKIINRTILANYTYPQPLCDVLFLEEVKIRGNTANFLTGSALENNDNIFDFFGDFQDIIYLNNLDIGFDLGILTPDSIKIFKSQKQDGRICDFSLE